MATCATSTTFRFQAPRTSTRGGPFIEPTQENVANRTYPFTRSVWLYVNREPGKMLDPKVAEFLRFVLSREGQALVKPDGDYFPLTANVATEEMAKLDFK